jgi:YSIRK-targeted surface antigen transcriptional regulator
MEVTMENIEYVCKLLFTTYKIPIYFVNTHGILVFEFTVGNQPNPFYSSKMDILEQLMAEDCPFPLFRSTTNLENFFSISVPDGKILAGPVLYSKLPIDTINGLINDLQHHINKELAYQYYQSLPVLSQIHFMNMSMVLYYMLFQKQLDLVDISQQNQQLEKVQIQLEQPDVQIAIRRQNTLVHHDPLSEKKIFDCIRSGKKEDMLHHLRALSETGEPGVLSKKSYLRSQKNLAIAAITLATRAAVDGGLYPEIAYTLSDLFIQNVEELHDRMAVDRLVENALLEFTERVGKSKTHMYSKPVYVCQNHIFTHLYEELTLPHLAEAAMINPNYLSALFKKEVGISISEYIQRAKVEEAKTLITYTSHPLTEISSLLNFHDQSHFTKVFKKFAGVTPKQFKSGGVGS